MLHTPTKTPVKIHSRFLDFTPKTKTQLCNICGKYFEHSRDRRVLIKDGVLTNAGALFSEVLNVDVENVGKTRLICRYCQARLDTAKNKKDKLLEDYCQTQQSLIKKYTVSIKKRSQATQDAAVNPQKRRSLFQDENKSLDQESEFQNKENKEKSNDIWVRMSYPSGTRNIKIQDPFADIVRACTSNSLQHLAKVILSNRDIRSHIQREMYNIISQEMIYISSQLFDSILRKSEMEDLLKFSWNTLCEELTSGAPTFLSFLKASVDNPSRSRNVSKTSQTIIPAMLSAGATLISLFNRDMSAVKKIKSIVLKKGGLKKAGFLRLSALDDCLSYQGTMDILDKYGADFDKHILQWKNDVEEGEDGLFVFASDNVDWEIKPRQVTTTHTSKSVHKTHALAIKCRVPTLHLPSDAPLQDVQTVPLQDYMPSPADNAALEDDLIHLISQIWVNSVTPLSSFKDALPTHIPHKYEDEMKKKSVPAFLGCYDIDQKVTDEVQSLLELFNDKYIPHHGEIPDQIPEKIVAFADYLGFERQKAAQSQVRDARTPSQRLEGFISGLSDFHAQAVWHCVIWHHLYNTSSGNETGTLYHARQILRARNVTMDPHSNFYASEELLDKFTKAYIIAGALTHFGMNSIEDDINLNAYEGSDDLESKLVYIRDQVRSFVRKHVLSPPPSLQGPQLKCRYCNKIYKIKTALRKHERDHRNQLQTHDGTGFQCQICGKVYVRQKNLETHMEQHREDNIEEEDRVYNYTRTTLTLCCLRLNMEDAIKLGDGERLMLCYKYMYLYCKESGHTKYAYGLLETVAQTQVLLSPRVAESIMWNRFVNTQGGLYSNFPVDLFVEHQNHPLKRDVKTFRGEITDKTLQRVSRSLNESESILRQFDKTTKVFRPAGKHKEVDKTADIISLAANIHETGRVFQQIPGRYHREFRSMTANPLENLDSLELQKWLKKTVKGSNGFCNKHYYKL